MSNKYRVLVIDDEDDFCHFLKLNLELTGNFEVIIAREGRAGVDLAKSARPDLVLLDIRMPGMSASEVLSVLQRENFTKDIPVIFLTGLVVKDEAGDDVLKKSGYPFITKPVTTAEIIKQIKLVLEKN